MSKAALGRAVTGVRGGRLRDEAPLYWLKEGDEGCSLTQEQSSHLSGCLFLQYLKQLFLISQLYPPRPRIAVSTLEQDTQQRLQTRLAKW